MNPTEVHSYLNSFVNFESQLHKLGPEDFHLDRIQKFLDLAGNPARDLKIIHVAGTKGKGSTCAFLAFILQAAGYKVGLYTSPHLYKVNERIRILDGNFSGAISDTDLGDRLTFLRPYAAAIQNEGSILTYFEVLTVAALSYFAKAKVDIVILETGLGGRLDATNAANSMIAVITPISMDHTQILGNTLRKIAVEKAGIIKNSQQKVVIAPQQKEALDVLLERCREFGIQPILVDPLSVEKFKIGLKGRHQLINAATALEAAKILIIKGFKINEAAISAGLKNVRWPGRFEVIYHGPEVVVDCAHNEASAQALAQTLKDEYPKREVILVLGISQDKDVEAICRSLNAVVGRVFLTRVRHPRAHIFTDAEAKNLFCDKPVKIIESLPQALETALHQAEPQDVVLVTGSVFIVAEALDFFV